MFACIASLKIILSTARELSRFLNNEFGMYNGVGVREAIPDTGW
jgi:hypothetical protein